jgi:hypothetical protein
MESGSEPSPPVPPGTPPERGSIDLSDASVGKLTGGPGSESGSDDRQPDCAGLRPFPLLRSPEFGPDDDIEVLLESIRRKLPGIFHVGRSRSDHGDYADDVCMGGEERGFRRISSMGGMFEVLEARDEAMRLRSRPGEEDVDAVLRDASLCGQSIEL